MLSSLEKTSSIEETYVCKTSSSGETKQVPCIEVINIALNMLRKQGCLRLFFVEMTGKFYFTDFDKDCRYTVNSGVIKKVIKAAKEQNICVNQEDEEDIFGNLLNIRLVESKV